MELRFSVAIRCNVSDGPQGKLTRCSSRPTVPNVTVTISLRGPCQTVSSIIYKAAGGLSRMLLTVAAKKLSLQKEAS